MPKVKVTGPYQVVHEGKVHTAGDTIDAPEADTAQWVAAGYVEVVKPSRSKKSTAEGGASKHKKAPNPDPSDK